MSLLKPSFTIRARVLVLVILAMAPIVLERVSGLQVGRTDRIRMTETTMGDLARQGADVYGQTLSFARTLMGAAALSQSDGRIDPATCGKAMQELDHGSDVIDSLSIASVDGRVLCSSMPDLVGTQIGDRPYFKDAVATSAFTVSGMLMSRIRNRPIVPAALPKLAPDHTTAFVVISTLNLSWIDGLVFNVLNGRNLTASIVDREGIVIARYPESETLVEHVITGHALFKQIASGRAETFTAADLDGTSRIFAAAKLGDSGSFVVGIDRAQVLMNINHQITVAYAVIMATVLAALLGAYFGSERFILRPLRALVDKAVRYGQGDFTLRPTLATSPPEFAPLGRALERMAQQLAVREHNLIAENRHLDHLAQLDGLTGVANRRSFDERLRAEWMSSATTGQPLSLLMIDVDHFKRFNDRYGHMAGDACLKAVAARLSQGELRRNDFVARYGGEEFAVVLPSLTPQAAVEIAERLRQAVFDLAIENSQAPACCITISVGVAGFVGDGAQDAGALIEAADTALYNAKRRGRNVVSARASKLVDVLAG